MTRRHKAMLLPPDLRKELDRLLIANSFTGYRELSKWLAEQGYRISAAGLTRYAERFEQRLEQVKLATAQARAIIEASPDD